MAKMKPCVFLLLTLLIAANTSAAPVKIVGFDDMSCRNWSKSKEDSDQRKTLIAWTRGVLTGHNYANQRQQVSAVSSGTVENFVDRYCSENPSGDFSDAAMRMADKFSGRNEVLAK